MLAVATPATAMLSRWYHEARDARAAHAYVRGMRLRDAGRAEVAIEDLRKAVSLDRSRNEYRLGLVRLLLDAGRAAEARAVLSDVLGREPTNAPANLMNARAERALTRPHEAERYYRRAIHGEWPAGTASDRDEAIVELTELVLAGETPPEDVQGIMARGVEWPETIEARRQLAVLLVRAHLPGAVVDALRPVVAVRPDDAEAWSWLAAAQFNLGEYVDARASARRALRLTPSDEETARRLDLVERVLALDPTAARLSDRERARRARRVLDLSGEALARCVGDGASDPELNALLQSVATRRAKRRPTDDSAPDLELAEQAWTRTQAQCPGAEADPALPLLMRRLRETAS